MTTEQKAVDLINEVRRERKLPPFSIEVISRHTNDWDEALCRAIEAGDALARFSQHIDHCKSLDWHDADEPRKSCTCGKDDAMANWHEAKGEQHG